MKKLVIAGVCGLCMMAACAFATTTGNASVAGSGSGIHIRI